MRSSTPTPAPPRGRGASGPKPAWLKARAPGGPTYERLRGLMRDEGLHTVCEEARCPNIGECWNSGTATFLILGKVCTRACGYCQVTSGRPGPLDADEPRRVAMTVERMGLEHAVITSVNRDDVPDGGAALFVETVRWIRRLSPGATVELLIPDFDGNWEALDDRPAGRAGDPQSQHGDGAPPLPHRAPQGALRAQPGAAATGRRLVAAAGHEERPDAGAGRNDGRDRRRPARPPRPWAATS